MSKRMIYDFETRSDLNVKHVGAFKYASHRSTQVMCVGYRLGPIRKLWYPLKENIPPELYAALNDKSRVVVAHNAFFEYCIHNITLKNAHPQKQFPIPKLEHERFSCTAARARYRALPGKLEILAKVLNLGVEKDMEGHRLMLRMARPRKPSKDNKAKWNETPEQMTRLGQYCLTDVDVEYEIDKILPELPPDERNLWLMDQRMNAHGVQVDVKTCKTIKKLVTAYTEELTTEIKELTNGKVQSIGQTNDLKAYLTEVGVDIPNVQAKTIEKTLSEIGNSPEWANAKRVMEIRQSLSKASVKKYDALIGRTDSRGVLRDLWIYHTATTGRAGGAGFQPHNLPRGSVADIETALDAAQLGDLKFIEFMYDQPLNVFSSLLRSMITARAGKELFCADFAAIELRVLMWLVGQENALEMLRRGDDLYKAMAAVIYHKAIEDITKDERFTGKEAVLGCGYQMGWQKFQKSVFEKSGRVISDALAQRTVKAYRETWHKVPAFWRRVEQAAIFSVANKKHIRFGKLEFRTEKDFLFCTLPSGRDMSYPYPELRNVLTKWGDRKLTLFHGGIDTYTKKWVVSGTYGGRLTENICQGIARDFMMQGALNCEASGYDLLLTVHDELVCEKDIGKGKVDEFENLMSGVPFWGEDCPVKAEGWNGPRYKK